jgi:hypothetical protein
MIKVKTESGNECFLEFPVQQDELRECLRGRIAEATTTEQGGPYHAEAAREYLEGFIVPKGYDSCRVCGRAVPPFAEVDFHYCSSSVCELHADDIEDDQLPF